MSHLTRRRNDEEELFNDSDMANRLCAGEIDGAIRACEYGDGSHKLEPAVLALVEQFGAERLNFVLAIEVLRNSSSFSDDNRAWAEGFTILNSFAECGVRTRTSVLDEFITCLRETTEREKNMEVNSMGEHKTIKFITSDYKELFQIPDGGSIKITYPPGDGREPVTRACKYHDDYHFETLGRGGDMYHICQFAEIMERLGARYEPEVQLRDVEIVPFSPGDEKFYTYNREEGNTCIGHISGEFGQNGAHYFSNWRDRENGRNTPEFQGELHSAIYALRQDMLMDYNHMLSYCETHPEALIDSGDKYKQYGFRLETDSRQYFVQCFFGEYVNDARFIVYPYDKPAPELEQAQPAFGVVAPATAAESDMFYRNETEGNLCIGHLRGDHGKNGNEFWNNWFDSDNGSGKKTPEFQAEFQTVMETLRQGVLKDRESSLAYCHKYPEAKLPGWGDGYHYGFKLETESRQYFIRCTLLQNDYVYVFAYDKAAAREQERPAAEQASVLKQIREAQKAPKTPRKSKSTDKKKDGAEL